MQPDANSDSLLRVLVVVSGEPLLNGDGALQRATGARKGHHEAVALRLDLEPSEHRDLLADHVVVGAQHVLRPPVPQPLRHGGRTFDIGEEDCDGSIRCGVMPQVRTLGLYG